MPLFAAPISFPVLARPAGKQLPWSANSRAKRLGVEAAEKRSRVAYDIEPYLDAVRLTVTHDELEPGPDMLHGITQGWPMVLSSMKTLLETGQALPMTTRRWSGPPA